MNVNFNNAEFVTSYFDGKKIDRPRNPEIVLVGRSNVGKSSLINKLLNRKSLARVSSVPGKTISVNYYSVDGKFDLVDLPGARLNETIPDFHNTPKRLEALNAAVKADICGRLKDVGPELDFIMARAGDCSRLVDLCTAGDIPERITHNDTKLNNILIDDVSGEGICVIDLDTVMPGLVHYDFGDMVRTGTSPAAEDERDLSKVTMRFEMFEALLRGYLASADKFLNPCEREELPFAGKLITLENGIRFLTDYLQGDTYFKTHRPNHNLDRCRTQLKLVSDMQKKWYAMNDIVAKLAAELRG